MGDLSGESDQVAQLRADLRADLKRAMKDRDRDAMPALRSVLAALDNAEAVAVENTPATASNQHVAGSLVGLGAGESARKHLTMTVAKGIIATEIDERLTAAQEFDAMGRTDRAQTLRRESDALRDYREPRP